MNLIWKYELTQTTLNTLEMPVGAKVLTVQMQHNIPCVWALVKVGTPSLTGAAYCKVERRTFEIVGTGQPFENADKATYIGTVQMLGGSLIWHIFEITEK